MREPRYYRKFAYNRALLPNPQLVRLEEGVTDIETARSRSGMTIGYPGWGLLYYATLCALDPAGENVIVETGTNLGCSTMVLAQALADSGAEGRVYTIEIDEDVRRQAIANLRAARVAERVESLLGDAKATLPGLVAGFDEIRVAFLDGSHLVDDVVTEFEAVRPKLAERGVVLFDNTYLIAEPNEDQRVNGALRQILAAHGGHVVNFPYVSWYTPGVAIWQQDPFPEWAAR